MHEVIGDIQTIILTPLNLEWLIGQAHVVRIMQGDKIGNDIDALCIAHFVLAGSNGKPGERPTTRVAASLHTHGSYRYTGGWQCRHAAQLGPRFVMVLIPAPHN